MSFGYEDINPVHRELDDAILAVCEPVSAPAYMRLVSARIALDDKFTKLRDEYAMLARKLEAAEAFIKAAKGRHDLAAASLAQASYHFDCAK